MLWEQNINSWLLERYGRYSTFQYPDQDAYQYPYPDDFNAPHALFHVSVSGSGCLSVSVSGWFQCTERPIPRLSIRQTYLPVFTLL